MKLNDDITEIIGSVVFLLLLASTLFLACFLF